MKKILVTGANGQLGNDHILLGQFQRGLYHGVVGIEYALRTMSLGCNGVVMRQYRVGVYQPLEVLVEWQCTLLLGTISCAKEAGACGYACLVDACSRRHYACWVTLHAQWCAQFVGGQFTAPHLGQCLMVVAG